MEEKLSDTDRLLTDLIIAEHQTYWNKFTAFSALNLGLIILVLQPDQSALYLPIIGGVLSCFWVLVQWLSYHYVCYYGDKFQDVAERLGVRDDSTGFWLGFVRPTLIAVLVALLILCFWIERVIAIINSMQ